MATPQNLLWVTSAPKTVSAESWIQWYLEEHLKDLVKSKCVSTGALYQEVPLDPKVKVDRPFLAVYQSDFKEPMRSQEYLDSLPGGAEVFKAQGLSTNPLDNGDFDVRNYELVQDFDPNSVGNVTSPFILTVEMNTTSPSEFDDWYRNEHLPLLSKMPGFQRALRYKIGPASGLNTVDPAMLLTVYFIEDPAKAFGSEEAAKANATELTKKFLADSKPAAVGTCWKLLGKEWEEGGSKL